MHNDGNVVPLHKATIDQAIHSPLTRLPVVLLQVRDKAVLQLQKGLQDLFDNADDTLFEMTDRARDSVEQNIYFQAMRDLRLKRKSFERLFFDQIFEAFARLSRYDITPVNAPLALSTGASVTQPEDELERTVAIEAMVNKILSRDGLALDQLTARISTLLGKTLIEKHNPLGPTLLCEFFLQAGRSLGVEIKVKLIILKLFEHYVLNGADQLYGEANQLLVVMGVLPDLKPAPARAIAAPADTPAAVELQVPALDDSLPPAFLALQDLLSHVRGSFAPILEASAPTQAISSRDLLRLLSYLQQYVPTYAHQEEFLLRNQLEQLLTRVSVKSGKSRVLRVADVDVINLIAMLFEYIRDDRNLPKSLKALVGQLQIPMVKIAVLDKNFFSRGNHPARRLLNEIASAALGWSDGDDVQRDSLYLRIEQVVKRLLNDFIDDPTIFSELLTDFLAFTSDERRRSELLEQRTRDAEEGRAKAALARRHVEQALNQALLGKSLPRSVVMFVQDAWSKVLLLTSLKHGDQSMQWRAAVQSMEQLIWSVQRHDEPDAHSRLLALVPSLLKALREGLSGSAFDPFATSEFFSELEGLHVQLFEPVPSAPTDAPERVLLLETIVLPSADEGVTKAAPVPLPVDDIGLHLVDQLRLGNWVEFQEDQDNTLRCKLAAIIDATDHYIFVNRTGMKVLERSRTSLAMEFHHGAVRTLDDTLLFDRALESVTGNLRRLERGK
jgi:hypothetical protein